MDRKPYTEKEKILLASLVKDYGGVIENKKTDGSTLNKKLQAWDKITTIYNCQPDVNCSRNAKQLRKLWDNLKQKKRKEMTNHRYNQLLTGGGPPEKAEIDPVMSLVDIAAPHADVILKNELDSVAVYEMDHKKTPVTTETISILVTDDEAEQTPAEFDMIVEHTETCQPQVTQDTPSTSTAKENCTPGTSKRRKLSLKRPGSNIDEEIYWRVLKAKEAVEHQRQLHEKRMMTAEIEHEIALIKFKKIKNENNLQ